ncbi:MAG: zinc ribbon domain-containing protein [Armatimonadota bacterium]|nr:MAG: zinc ribbon domain-containing protein [Armatimonadota bacterium]
MSGNGSRERPNVLSCPRCGREHPATATKCEACGIGLVWADEADSTAGLASRAPRGLARGVSVTGLVIGGLLVMVALSAGPRMQLPQLAAGLALVARSFFLPLGFPRGLATWFGGYVVGIGIRHVVGPAPSISGSPGNTITPAGVLSAIVFVGLGIVLLALGATRPRPKSL